MSFSRLKLFVVLILPVTACWAQSNRRQPHIGYLYPAGGRQASVIQILAGGQFLRNATDVYVSGAGVHAEVIKYMNPPRNFNKEQRQLLKMRMKQVRDKRLAELPGKARKRPIPLEREFQRIAPGKPRTTKAENTAKIEEEKLPNHPLLYDLENKSLRELAHITDVFLTSRRKRQFNRQITESVLIKVTIDPGAKPGNREFRIKTAAGLTNPMLFQVGLFPETRELEPNNQKAYADLPGLPKPESLEPPILFNGQIMSGDVDRFRFRARWGQQLVIETQARSLVPYLADAVPGWFQATIALYDDKGNEVGFADDYRFNPDPVLFYKIPEDGEYELEIRDAIYRGREDFVYRISVGEQPYITQTFPLGGRKGVKTVASVEGWNLPASRLLLDTHPGDDPIRRTAYNDGKLLSNPVTYTVDTLPECNEVESNNTVKKSQPIDLPIIVNGRIYKFSDVDVFSFSGRSGDKVVVEVYARRLNSPLDSLLRLTDASGKVLKWNDDYVVKDSHLYRDTMGLVTHHADSYLLTALPADGTYYVHLADSQHHGGREYAYRLRIAAPQPDFEIRITPSSLSMRAGGIIPFCVHALRKDGFDGRIKVVLEDAPTGFEINGGWIPAGSDTVRMTLTASSKPPSQPVALYLRGLARINGQMVSRTAVPSEDMMQAFLYRHLVPSQKLMVSVKQVKWPTPPVELAVRSPVRLPVDGSAQVRLKTRKRKALKEMQLELDHPPDGVTLHDVAVVPEGLAFRLKADKDTVKNGLADNLIVEAYREVTPKNKRGKAAKKKNRVSMGFFPAIPIEIVKR
jgi:hypothetical protein